MTLTRVWTPTGNYSGGGGKRLIVIHSMEGFTGANGAYDCAKYFQTDCGASSQVCIDNNRGKVWECVTRGNGSWTQCQYNSVSVSCEQSGYASWSRDYWLNNREPQLRNIAEWIAEESSHFGIPIQDLTASQAQGGSWGVCYHSELGSAGCGHSDPGGGWPIDKVLEWARGGGTPAPPEGILVSSDVAFYQGKQYFAYIDQQGHVCMNGSAVDPGSNAKSGVGLDIDQATGKKVITYTNQGGKLCIYEQQPGSTDWGWASKEWNAK